MSGLILQTKSSGTISAYSDSAFRNAVKGEIFGNGKSVGGVFATEAGSLSAAVDQTARTVTIGTGYGMAYGREFQVAAAQQFDLAGLGEIKYCLIYAVISTKNVTNEKAELKLAYDGGGYPAESGKDIVSEERAIAYIPLYRFIYTATAASPIGAIERLFEYYEPGTYQKTRSLPLNANANGQEFSELLYRGTQQFQSARKADYAKSSDHPGGVSVSGTLGLAEGALTVSTNSILIRPNGHFGPDSGIDEDAWVGQDTRTEYPLTKTSCMEASKWEPVACFWKAVVRSAFWKIGFFGAGSHWEYSNNTLTVRGIAMRSGLISFHNSNDAVKEIQYDGFSFESLDDLVVPLALYFQIPFEGWGNSMPKIIVCNGEEEQWNHWIPHFGSLEVRYLWRRKQ